MHFNSLLVTITGALLLVYRVEAADDNPCDGLTGTSIFLKCDGCHGMAICMGSTLVTKPTCGSQFCNYDVDSGVATCEDDAPVGCVSETTTTTEATTTTTTVATTTPVPQATNILCTGVGIYPDPYDCNRYHYCPAKGQKSFDQACPPNYAFNQSASAGFPCQEILEPTDCIVIDCTTSTTIFAPYGTANIYFAHCKADSTTGLPTVSMFKCSEEAQFDGTKCVFKCPQEGLFPNTEDPNTYYQCYLFEESLVYRLMSCPSQKTFNGQLRACTK